MKNDCLKIYGKMSFVLVVIFQFCAEADHNDNVRYAILPEDKKERGTAQVHVIPAAVCLLGFYVMILLGFINRFLFKPKHHEERDHRLVRIPRYI